jgi:transposase-like protein
MLTAFVQTVMSADADAICGAEYGTRSPDRTNRRNGYRPREWDTRVGTIELASPKPLRRVHGETDHCPPEAPEPVGRRPLVAGRVAP